MGVYGFHLLAWDGAFETLQAVGREFGVAGDLPPEPSSPDVAILAEHGAEMTRWVTSAAFTAKAFASKDARLIVLATALMECGAPMPPTLRQKAIAAANYLGLSHPAKTAADVYRLGEFARLLRGYSGAPVLTSGSMGELLRRDAIEPHDATSLPSGLQRWVLRDGRVCFADDAARGRACYALGGGLHRAEPSSMPDPEVLAELATMTAQRPPFNLRLGADLELWADLQACASDVAAGRAVAGPLAGAKARLDAICDLLRMEATPEMAVKPESPRGH